MERDKNKVFRIKGIVKHYAWGGVSFLPDLLNIPNPDNKPFAEYWMGAHDNASASILFPEAGPIALNEYIRSFPNDTLGADISRRFGRLPFLLKILDVKDMLSIQVHPSKKNAEKGFEAENEKKIPVNAAHRNYRDDNHKPELILALSEFWLLHGFKPPDQLLDTLRQIPELNFLLAVFKNGYSDLYRTVMQMEQTHVNRILQPLLDRIIPDYEHERLDKKSEDFWAARAALTFNSRDKTDRGIFSIYLFNLCQLHPGEAVFQAAGLPHAYLEGQNVEIMANSDNVLRGGLTQKHIDVNELMRHVRFEPTIPEIIRERKEEDHLGRFITSAPDFELHRIELKKNESLSLFSHSIEIFFVLQGELLVHENDQNELLLGRGGAMLSFDQASFSISARENTLVCFAAIPAT